MGMKLKRGRYSPSRYRKKKTWPRVLGWFFAAILVVAAGFFGAGLLDRLPADGQPDSSTPSVSDPTPNTPDIPDPTPTTPQDKPADTKPQPDAPIRGFYLPVAKLSNVDSLKTTLADAAKAGFNAVVFDLKDSTGALHYRFTGTMAQQANTYTEIALTGDQLQAAFTAIREAGLRPIPRLYAFQDHLGAKALSAARITPQGNPGWTWYDNDPNNGGKAWLNPYADEAHTYLVQLATELQEAGAFAILLDGVQFPKQTSLANYGNSSNTSLNRDEVLALFVDKVKQALEDCRVILSCTAQGALGTDTGVYGNNPLTFAPHMAAPTLFPNKLPATIKIGDTKLQNSPDTLGDTIKALVGQIALRTKVMAEETRPALIPWLQGEGYSTAQIRQEMDGCLAGEVEEYLLYHPDGTYDFVALAG